MSDSSGLGIPLTSGGRVPLCTAHIMRKAGPPAKHKFWLLIDDYHIRQLALLFCRNLLTIVYNDAFTSTETGTDTNTDEMGTVPSVDQYRSLVSVQYEYFCKIALSP